ncbi:alpha/beta hydrolase [Flagellimonas iocasae]|uniref:Alpha/beta hydrolase n=1 Tax=Flagellimonas iocasae TaxID=2055905 RepID=A0ABW4XV34_9FLAO
MKNRIIEFTIPFALFMVQCINAQEVIQLESITAPEGWQWTRPEEIVDTPDPNNVVVANVSTPSITVYRPSAEKANGTALIIAPGGGFHMLSMTNGGTKVADWCVENGIAAFVLKYRLVPTHGNPQAEFMKKVQEGADKMDQEIKPIIELAKADGFAAITYVRQHAQEFGVKPDQIGIIGFSAGGALSGAAAFKFTNPTNRPDFVANIYPALQVVDTSHMPEQPMPMFIAVTSDDVFGFQTLSTQLYNQWNKAGEPVEMHIYEKGGHGFGMRKQDLPSDKWIDAFGEWLDSHGWITYKS